MKRLRIRLIIPLFLLIVLSAGIALTVYLHHYGWAAAGTFALLLAVIDIVRVATRSSRDMKRLVTAIRFSEFNTTFDRSVKKGLDPELADMLHRAIDTFNEKSLAREAELNFYEILLNRIDFAILVVDRSDTIVWINKSALGLLGKPRPKTLAALHDIHTELAALIERLTPGEVKTVSLRNAHAEHRLAVTTVTADIQGETLRIFSLKDMRPLMEETEEAAWKKLIHILTHEIMNSITPILSLTKTFSSEPATRDPELLLKAMQTVHRRSEGLVEFIRNYGKLTHIPPPNPTVFSASELLEHINDLLAAEKIIFHYRIDTPDDTIRADRGQVEQVLINLLRNAAEACEKCPAPEIGIVMERDEYNRPVIHVTDNGQGILPGLLDQVFVPFYSTKPRGSGIGLSLCRQIVTAHGGSFTVDSIPGSFTRFTIRL